MRDKKGNVVVIYPIVIIMAIMILVIVGMFFLNSIFPFIWYQKLNHIAQKYMFVIEKFGYLTDSERKNLQEELSEQGFDISKVIIQAPSARKSYGELIEFKLSYEYTYNNMNVLKNNMEKKKIDIKVSKCSYSKI